MKSPARLIAAGAMIAVASPSMAFDFGIQQRVTVIEASYMPDLIAIQIDATATSTCPAGTWLRWYAQGSTEATKIANINAVYSGLMTAMARNSTVTMYGVNTNCTIQFIWFNRQ